MAPESAVLEWRGVGANHRPEVRAEGNATEVCSAQSLATGLGGDGGVFVFSAQQSFYFHTFPASLPIYTSLSVQITLYVKIM